MWKESSLSKEFLQGLCRYYMEFLETDFKEQRPPNRKITIYDKNQILTGIKLSNYANLNQFALSLLQNEFQKNPLANVEKGKFVLRFPKEVVEQIRSRKNQPGTAPLQIVLQIILDYLKQQNLPHKEVILKNIHEKIKSKEIRDLNSLSEYVFLDFYDELYDLWKNKQVLDKQDFYLYFLELRYENNTYPIFYIPLELERTTEGIFNIELEPVFLINKKAIEYVSRKYAEARQKQWRIELPPRYIYLSDYENPNGFLKHLQSILNEICNFFELNPFSISTSESIESKNDKIKITNNCYFSIFDKSDEALLNDYEELLNLALQGEETKALEIFEKLAADYIFLKTQKLLNLGLRKNIIANLLVIS